jgi:hypothetical protein
MNSDSAKTCRNPAKSGWLLFFFFSLSFLIFLGPKIVGEEQIWPGTWRRRRGFAGFRRIPVISWDSSQFSRFCRNYCSWFAGITVEDMLGTKKLLLRAFWKKVPTLRNYETSGGTLRIFKHRWPN